MAFAAGKSAYCSVQSNQKTFDSWVVTTSCETVDVSDYERRSAKTLPGLSRAAITLSGPYSVEDLGMHQGREYYVELGVTEDFYVDVNVLVDKITLAQSVRGVARVDVTGIVVGDIENEEAGSTTAFEDL